METLFIAIAAFGTGWACGNLQAFLESKPTFTNDPPPHPGAYGVVRLKRVPEAGWYWSADTDSPQTCDGWALEDGHLLPNGGQPVAWVDGQAVEKARKA